MVQISNVWDCLLKSRNSNYVGPGGLKERIVTYISSNKSKYVSDIMCHNGGKGNRNIVEKILDNSEKACEFKDPGRVSLFISFDNIQRLMKGHRLSEGEQEKVYGIIVCSILAVLPDGSEPSEIQFKPRNNLSSWFNELDYDNSKETYYNKLDTAIIKEMIKEDPDHWNAINKFWLEDLERNLEYVVKQTSSNGDSIDEKILEKQNKRIKICENGHRNTDVRSNRKRCTYCKAKLVEDAHEDSYYTFDGNDRVDPNIDHNEQSDQTQNSEEEHALYYMKVENIYSPFSPSEKSMGAEKINPNSSVRVQKVLDKIKKKTNMNKHYSVEIVLRNGKVIKTLIDDNERRSLVSIS